jgi:toxin ParE1/3/4
MLRLIVAPQAEADLRDAFMWYEEKSAGLGHDFLHRVELRLEQIVNTPQVFRLRWHRFRLAPIERFPYAIYFIWDETGNRVTVGRVLHFKRAARPTI